MTHFLTAALAGVLVAGLALPAVAQDDVTSDTVVATVNGEDITLGHMLVLRARLPEEFQRLSDDELYSGILEQLIQQALIGGTVSELSKVGRYVLENERRALLATEAVAAITETAVTDEAVQAEYDKMAADYLPEQEFNASHILVETEEAAQAIIDELAGGADFAELARTRSTGPSGPNGGSLGWFGKGMMVPPFEEAVLALEPGQVSGPVQTQFGWHVIRLNETRDTAAPPLEDVRTAIEEQLRGNAIVARIDELRGAALIERREGVDPSVISNGALLQE